MNRGPAPGPKLAALAVILTGRCNLDCAYCYRGGDGGGGGPNLEEDVLLDALDLALEAAGPDLEVIFSGGEPTLRFDVFARAVGRLRAGATAAGPVSLRLVSNGTLLTDDRVDFLVANDINLSLSVDGIPQVQRLRGAETAAAVDDLVARLRRRHPDFLAHRVRAVMTLLPHTVAHLAASVDHLLAAGIREIGVSPALVPVPGWDEDVRDALAPQLEAVRRRCERELAATGEVPFLPLRRYGPEVVPEGPEPGQCAPDEPGSFPCVIATGRAPVLDADGRLYSCLMFAPSGLGPDPQEDPLRRVAAGIDLGRPGETGYAQRAARLPEGLAGVAGFAPQSRLTSRLAACAVCPARALCTICPFALLRFAGNADCTRVPAFLCSFYQEVARHRALMPAQKPTGRARWRPDALEERRLRFLEKFGLPA